MALESSSNAYEDVYQSSGQEDHGKYCESYLDKKERFNKWTRYWCVLKYQNIHFFNDVNTQIKDNYVGYLALEQPTHVELIKSKLERYEWSIKTKKGKITLRTNVASLRDNWICSTEKSLKNEPPRKESYILEGSGPVSPIKPSSQLSRKSSLQEQVAFFQDFSSEIEGMKASTDEEIKIQDELLRDDKMWYQASYHREDADKILSSAERGVFLVRDYIDNNTKMKMGYVISLKDENNQIRHHKIKQINDSLVIIGHEGKSFDSLYSLLMFYILSQQKKLKLVPFNQEKHKLFSSKYENMVSAQSVHHQIVDHSRSLRGEHSHRAGQVSRSQSMQDRRLPSPPENEEMKTVTTGYVEMRSTHNQSRPLPLPPLQENLTTQTYMSPCSEPSRRPLPPPPGESYLNMSLPSATENSSYVNTENEPPRRPLPPAPGESYLNMSPPSVTENSTYVNTANVSDQSSYINTAAGAIAPTLPPKRRGSSNYSNYPRSNMPDRNPFRKSHTIS